MKVFVIHYKKLIERKVNIINQFKKHNITNYEFIDIDRDDLEKYNTNIFETNYTKSQMAISLSHFYAYKQISEKYDNGLIFEDDAILCNNFTNFFNKYINDLPSYYDMLFIGDGSKLHIKRNKLIPNKNIYQKCLYPTSWGGDGASRCTDSYLVSKKCANKLCEYIQHIENVGHKIKKPIDWWLNVAARDNKFIVYWAEPTIVTQGTQNKIYETSH
jgi:GR25 family glycosyltransferase involved in LPS biosynthesis